MVTYKWGFTQGKVGAGMENLSENKENYYKQKSLNKFLGGKAFSTV